MAVITILAAKIESTDSRLGRLGLHSDPHTLRVNKSSGLVRNVRLVLLEEDAVTHPGVNCKSTSITVSSIV